MHWNSCNCMSIDYSGFLLLIILLSTILCTKMCFSFWRDYCLKTNFLSVSKNSVDIVLQRSYNFITGIVCGFILHAFASTVVIAFHFCSAFLCVLVNLLRIGFFLTKWEFLFIEEMKIMNNEVTHNFILDFFDSCGVTIHIIRFYLHCPCSENLFWMVLLGVSFFSKIRRWTLQQWCLTRGLYLQLSEHMYALVSS